MTIGDPPATTTAEILSPSEISDFLVSETSVVTNPCVTCSVGYDEASAATLRPALSEGASPSAISSFGCGEAPSAAVLSCWGTPVPITTVGALSATTVDGIRNYHGYESVRNRLDLVWRGGLSRTMAGAVRGWESVLSLLR
jgi:hypothetical protein